MSTYVRVWWYSLAIAMLMVVLGRRALAQQETPPSAPAPVPASASTGHIAGRITDAATGAPLMDVRVTIVGDAAIIRTDSDGRYRTADLANGTYSIRVAQIGYQSMQRDGIQVASGRVAVDFKLSNKVIELEELVTQSPPSRKSSDAGLLAAQQNAPTVSDGVSAEAMSKSGDSDASDAITRVTGASVVGDKFVYVRGLGERYGNTLLNGTELPSPEPLKKVTPLDLFPTSLLESIVTTKAGRPDRPGDVTGAGVEIQTKEFPATRILQFNASQEYNSQTTFESVIRGPRNGSDRFAHDGGWRRPAGTMPTETNTPAAEQFAENIRNVWSPTARAPLNSGFGLNVGGTIVGGDSPFGGVFSLNYSAKTEHIPDRLYQLARNTSPDEEPVVGYRYRQTTTAVDWGAILNFTKRFGTSTKFSLRNLYTRSADELFLSYLGFNTDNPETDNSHGYQVQYVERDLFQTQLAGEHMLPWLLNSRLEWRGSTALANRDEPENRNLLYRGLPDGSEMLIPFKSNYFFFRFLDDRIKTGQIDWAVPLSLRTTADAEVKVGVLRRAKTRDFNAWTYNFHSRQGSIDSTFLRLPPERLFTPENLGAELVYERANGPPPEGVSAGVDPSYETTDDITSAYAMLDVPMYPRVRLVGGLRIERWRLALYRGSRDNPQGAPVIKENTDPLWSANLTINLSDRMNLRFAGYRSVARPEARELDPSYYVPVGGECGFYGNADLVRSTVLNGEARWELYPSPGEVISAGGFYKGFSNPIYEQIGFSSATSCSYRYHNAESARVYGAEAEVRKRLEFLSPTLRNFTVGTNFTFVSSRATVVPPGFADTVRYVRFVGQSPYLFNFNVSYAAPEHGFSGTMLLNYFDDRITRYGEMLKVATADTTMVIVIPDVVERGRTTLDVKLQQRLGRMAISASGKNLLNSSVRFVQPLDGGELIANAYDLGVTFSLGFGYDF